MITFTQYLRPNGRRTQVQIKRAADIEQKAATLVSKYNCKFELEELMTGKISMTIENNQVDEFGPVSMELCDNGPGTDEVVDKLVTRAFQKLESGEYPPKYPDEEDDA